MEVEFHSGLAEPLEHAARLLRKAVRLGERVCVATPQFEALSRRLWSEPEREFFVHARPGAAQGAFARSPVWLLPAFDARPADAPWPAVWVNLGAPAAPLEPACTRLIELVATDPEAVRAGRDRWRTYAARGWSPVKKFDGSVPA